MCGDVAIEQYDPTFFFTHQPASIGYEYQLCIKCGDLRYWQIFTNRPMQEKIKGGHVPERLIRPPKEGYINIQEACEKTRLRENTVRYYVREGKLEGKLVTVGKKNYWYVSVASIERYMEEQRDPRHLNRLQGSAAR